jgi:hypothetical protein
MKKLFNSVAMCCFLVLALGLTSCEETISMQQGYSFGVHKFNGSWDDPFVVENYFKVDKKVPYGQVVTEGSSEKDCDAKAKQLFDEAVAKLSHEEIAVLVSNGCSFVYSAERYDKAGNLVVIGEWAYPKK